MSKSIPTAEPIDIEIIEQYAREKRIEDPTVEQVLWLSRVLSELNCSVMRENFALVGGSAIVFLHRNMYRFSTDLDLDFIGNKDLGKGGKHEILNQLERDHSEFRRIAKKLGMKLKLKSKKLETAANNRFVQYELAFPSQYSHTEKSVEIDLSYRYCHTVLEPVYKKWPIYRKDLIPEFEVRTLSPEELYAGKIIAILEGKRIDFPGKIGLLFKRKIRHLYDVYLLADEILNGRNKLEIDIDMLCKLVLLFGLTRVKNFAFFRGESIVAYEEADKEIELVSVVPDGMPLPTVNEMKWIVRKFFDRYVLSFDERKHRFIEDFTAQNFRPEDLFDDREVKRLREMFYYKEILNKVTSLHK